MHGTIGALMSLLVSLSCMCLVRPVLRLWPGPCGCLVTPGDDIFLRTFARGWTQLYPELSFMLVTIPAWSLS